MKAVTIQIDDAVLDRVDGLAAALSRSRSWVIKQAIDRYLDCEEWFIQQIRDGLAEVERGEIATSEETAARFCKLGAKRL